MLSKLDNLSFHDGIILNLDIDFFNSYIKLIFKEQYDSNSIEIIFNKFDNLKISPLFDYEDFEIHSVSFKIVGNIFFAEFVFLLGFGKPSWELSFFFENFLINPSVSK